MIPDLALIISTLLVLPLSGQAMRESTTETELKEPTVIQGVSCQGSVYFYENSLTFYSLYKRLKSTACLIKRNIPIWLTRKQNLYRILIIKY